MVIWGEQHGSWIQAYAFIFGFGCMISPIVVEPFLVKSPQLTFSNSSSDFDYTNEEWSHNKTSKECFMESDNRTILRNSLIGESPLLYAFAIPSILKLMSFVVCAFTFVTSDRMQIKSNKDEGHESDARNLNLTPLSWTAFLVLLFFLSSIDGGLDASVGGYLMTFSVKYLGWTKYQGANLTFVFQGTYTLGCAFGIYIIKKLHPGTVLIINFSVCIVFSVILALFINAHDIVLWMCVAGVGLGVSTILGTIFTWTERQVGAHVRVNSIVLVGSGVGDMALPVVTGALMDRVHLMAFVYIIMCVAVSGMIIMVTLAKITKK